ncbi:endonuclease/exonuclease/phosphatase family protein [Nitratireductor sp. XY-223]|uniref:endonuclease/exonuclease/phosphatase family protein n=1 Tax=Nitratireductor sp. XY-223 TaxID=2561926 RepID=UPI00145B2441|nr:endonuclease/exonuclease/phosphatase family protein [Nitratireductor sp. XY-223]
MPKQTIATWNIFYSWTMVEMRSGSYRITPSESRRAKNVGRIINEMDADVLGIQECMSPAELKFFRDEKCPQYDGLMTNGDNRNFNLGLLYKKSIFKAKKVRINTDRWRAKIGDDRSERFYKFARAPLVVELEHVAAGTKLTVVVIHFKSKKPKKGLKGEAKYKEAIRNRKRIVAESLRIRELMAKRAEGGEPNNRYLIIGDLNDGPKYDRYEKQIYSSGIETLLGSVLDPENIHYSAIDLSDGKGEPTSSFADGSIQLDHIVHPKDIYYGREKPKIVRNSGKVRSDLVNIKRDGKKRDSDHAPVEVVIDF